MKRYLGALSALALFVGVASAEEVTGTLTAVDQEMRTITLDDGTTFSVVEGVALEGLVAGEEVTVSYEQVGDQRTASEIRPAEPAEEPAAE